MAPRTNLKGNRTLTYQLTTFIGRSVEVAEVSRLLHERRLVTLTGAGGSGKTRLALETAARLASSFAGGAFFADLAPLAEPQLVTETAAHVLGVEAVPACLCILATSREPLGVGGEYTLRVPLLSFPDPDFVSTPDEIIQFEAIQLFVVTQRLEMETRGYFPFDDSLVAGVLRRNLVASLEDAKDLLEASAGQA